MCKMIKFKMFNKTFNIFKKYKNESLTIQVNVMLHCYILFCLLFCICIQFINLHLLTCLLFKN